MQKGNRLQIPKYVRWGYQLETTEILKATIQVVNGYGFSQTLLTRTGKDGRVAIPKLIIQLLTPKPTGDQDYIIQVMLEPFSKY
jgi:hypothetical protein